MRGHHLHLVLHLGELRSLMHMSLELDLLLHLVLLRRLKVALLLLLLGRHGMGLHRGVLVLELG